MLDDTHDIIETKDSVIHVMKSDLESQLEQIQANESEIRLLRSELNDMRDQGEKQEN